jgi:hypothetical protein
MQWASVAKFPHDTRITRKLGERKRSSRDTKAHKEEEERE